ncbi:MAG: peptidylprolyl isomerase [Planctomycetes bacterium]|nr:peptidylprolyl isomerase [Planctomycetota bacterium]
MRTFALFCLSTFAATAAGCAGTRVAFDIVQGNEDLGRIVIELTDARTPVTVANFLRYVDDGFYDGTIIHRVNPEYVIQGGGYTAIAELKTEGLRPPIKLEAERGLRHVRGTIGMARELEPDTANSQFFINVVDNSPKLDFDGPRAPGYCAFGRVVAGLEVVDRIRTVKRTWNREYPDKIRSQPLDPPIVKRAYRLGASR